MGDIIARVLVRCSLDEADRGLLRFFERHANNDGLTAELELPADLEPLGPGGGLSLEGPALATIAAGPDRLETLPSYTVTWRPRDSCGFPTFVGSLWLAPLAGDELFELVIDGRYEPPIGRGATCFVTAADRTAQFMAAQLVAAMALAIESSTTGPLREEGEPNRHGTRPHRR